MNQVTGNFEIALRYVIDYLIDIGETEVLDNWDILRGNDWYTSTKLSEQIERALEPYGK